MYVCRCVGVSESVLIRRFVCCCLKLNSSSVLLFLCVLKVCDLCSSPYIRIGTVLMQNFAVLINLVLDKLE